MRSTVAKGMSFRSTTVHLILSFEQDLGAIGSLNVPFELDSELATRRSTGATLDDDRRQLRRLYGTLNLDLNPKLDLNFMRSNLLIDIHDGLMKVVSRRVDHPAR